MKLVKNKGAGRSRLSVAFRGLHTKNGFMEVFKVTKVHIACVSFNEPSQIKQITLLFCWNFKHELGCSLFAPQFDPFFGIFVTFYTWPIIYLGNPFCTLIYDNASRKL